MTDTFVPAAPRIGFASEPGPPILLRLSTVGSWVSVIGLSALLGVVMSKSAMVSTLHLVLTMALVAIVAVVSRRPDPIVAITIYAGMCDVLWRSTGAHGPYEASKYALIIGLTVLGLRFIRRPRNLGVTLGILVLLVPGIILGAADMPVANVREQLSSNVSGLIAVALAVLVCSNLRLSIREMRGIYLVALSPVVSLCAHATFNTVQAKTLNFSNNVNVTASGGFGPNQVSTALSFGALLCILVLLQHGIGTHYRVLLVITTGWLVGQAILTFSRGGLFALVLSGAAIGIAALSASGQRTRVIIAVSVLAVVGIRILSWAGAFTGGQSAKRLSETDSTNRTTIAMGDLRLFRDHPIEGVGVGVSGFIRDPPAATHTEYTRLLAEHGFLGVLILGLLATICVRLIRTAKHWYRLAAVGIIVMALSQMTHSATRIGSLAVSFALVSFLEDPT